MSNITLGEFVEAIETQFTDLGLELTRLDDDLAWLYFHNNTHRATLRVSISGLESNYVRIRFVVESFSPEPNENGLFDGTIWSGFESIETAIVQLLKVRTEIKRETLEA
jgi:hypothetical protein